jgi:hypothetical protein
MSHTGRTLDDIFAEFAALTASAKRPLPRRSRRIEGLRRAATAGVSVVAVVTVATAMAFAFANFQSPAQSGHSLPTHHLRNIDDLGSAKQIGVADVRFRDGCLYVDDGKTSWVVVWPTGTTLDESEDPFVVRNGRGEKIVAADEVFRMRGASYEVREIELIRDYLDAEIPIGCLTGKILLAAADVSALQPAPATWRVDPNQSPAPNSTELSVLLRERACAAGRPPYDRLETPEIEYRPDAIVIKLSVRVIGGACRNPEYAVRVALDEQVGDRALIDGSTGDVQWPPQPVQWTPQPSRRVDGD